MTLELIQGDCLIELKKIKAKSVDFVYLDLPYGQTACSWDKKIDLTLLWIELKRIARNDRTPFFFSCTTKFGFDLIEANKKWFRWDLVWKKNRAAGFLNAYRLPMRKHEMIYCFAKKSPEYDVSSHKDFVVDKREGKGLKQGGGAYGTDCKDSINLKRHKNKLPTSDITPPTEEHELVYCFAKDCPKYDVSSHKELINEQQPISKDKPFTDVYGVDKNIRGKKHKDPLPTSDITPPTDEHELVYCFAKKTPEYDVSSHKEFVQITENRTKPNCELYGEDRTETHKLFKEPLPTSDITPPTDEHELVYCFAKKTPEYDVSSHLTGEEKDIKNNTKWLLDTNGERKCFNKEIVKGKVVKDPLPTSEILLEEEQPSSWCEFNLDTKTGHRTAKPIKLMEFLLKYWTKEGQTILDPTAGSGSMGVACKNMNRNFIGIEKDPDIFKLMEKRIDDTPIPPVKVEIPNPESVTSPK